MATLTIRIPESKHQRLKKLAERQGLSLNKLFEEWSNLAITQFDAEARFRARTAQGNPKRVLQILGRLDVEFSKKSK